MPKAIPDAPVAYAEAAALAQRLDRARERGAVLLIDGRHVVTGFAHNPKLGVIYILFDGDGATFTGNVRTKTPAEFESYWQGRIMVTYPGPWPTGEPVDELTLDRAMGAVEKPIELLSNALSWNAPLDPETLGELAESAARLVHVCRELATETGENAG